MDPKFWTHTLAPRDCEMRATELEDANRERSALIGHEVSHAGFPNFCSLEAASSKTWAISLNADCGSVVLRQTQVYSGFTSFPATFYIRCCIHFLTNVVDLDDVHYWSTLAWLKMIRNWLRVLGFYSQRDPKVTDESLVQESSGNAPTYRTWLARARASMTSGGDYTCTCGWNTNHYRAHLPRRMHVWLSPDSFSLLRFKNLRLKSLVNGERFGWDMPPARDGHTPHYTPPRTHGHARTRTPVQYRCSRQTHRTGGRGSQNVWTSKAWAIGRHFGRRRVRAYMQTHTCARAQWQGRAVQWTVDSQQGISRIKIRQDPLSLPLRRVPTTFLMFTDGDEAGGCEWNIQLSDDKRHRDMMLMTCESC